MLAHSLSHGHSGIFCTVNQQVADSSLTQKSLTEKDSSKEITYKGIHRAKDSKRMVRYPGTGNSETRLSLFGLKGPRGEILLPEPSGVLGHLLM